MLRPLARLVYYRGIFTAGAGVMKAIRWVLVSLMVGGAWTFPATTTAAQRQSNWVWESVPRVVAVGDVHGRYDELVPILQGTGVVDAKLSWAGAKDHLVLCGDLIDRGSEDRAVIDLARRLQKEAANAGGRVHVVLGNHEAMNLIRDFRYVTEGSFAEFAKDEQKKDRRAAWSKYKEALSTPETSSDELLAAFDEHYPPGYFARVRAFGRKGDYGKWLLEQPAIVKINGVVFLHGGLTPEWATLGIDGINRRVRESLESLIESSEVLEKFIKIPAGFSEIYSLADNVMSAKASGKELVDEVVAASETMLAQIDGIALTPTGPLWYRGNSLANERVGREPMSLVLTQLNARAMMVGHTVTKTGKISTRFNARLYRGDVGMGYGRSGSALIFEGDQARVFDPASRDVSSPVAEPPYGEGWSKAYVHLPDVLLERAFKEAEVKKRTEITRDGRSAELWELERGGLKLRVVFKDIEETPSSQSDAPRRYQHEYAAYWLDRKIGLGFVPVVVIRSHDGDTGALRSVLETAVDLVSLKDYLNMEDAARDEVVEAVAEHYGKDLPELREQVLSARAFEALVGNQDQRDYAKLFIPAEGRVALVDHERAFGISSEIPADLLATYCPIPADIALALECLSREELQEGLGAYLSDSQIGALLERRDRILSSCSNPN